MSIKLHATELSQIGTLYPSAVVSFSNWPLVTYTTDPFEVKVISCSDNTIEEMYFDSFIAESWVYEYEIGAEKTFLDALTVRSQNPSCQVDLKVQ